MNRFLNRGTRLLRLTALVLLLILFLSLPSAAETEDQTDEQEKTIAERAAEAQKDIRSRSVGQYGMLPVYGRDIQDGSYPVRVDSSSAFFRILDAQLTVDGEELSVKITVSSLSYLYVFPGSAEEAERAPEGEYISYEEDSGHAVFTLPIEALDTPVPCAAYSKRRKRWYDRELVFYASSLPEDVLRLELPDYELIEAAIRAYDAGPLEESRPSAPHKLPEPVSLPRSDGEYSIEVNMVGGSGRAAISSPTLLIVRDGKAYARLLWSSPNYDYMILEEEVYHNLSTDGGNSTFEIPITVMDKGMPVIADTTAMGDPVEIEYTLTFYAESIGDKGMIPQEAAKKVLLVAAVIIVLGGVLNWLLKKKRK
ncbi:MAG: hypothetical protein IKO91_08095 [Oscillospiraceae bacterium]|nr:hypothetical protein [Oscillospiraceae bacterium]